MHIVPTISPPRRIVGVTGVRMVLLHRPEVRFAEADGFLYNMVRAIAGTLMYVGRGYWP